MRERGDLHRDARRAEYEGSAEHCHPSRGRRSQGTQTEHKADEAEADEGHDQRGSPDVFVGGYDPRETLLLEEVRGVGIGDRHRRVATRWLAKRLQS